MALRTFVKVGSITNLTDARYCAGMGVDLLGFEVIEGAPNYISPKTFQEIRGWVSGPKIVAEVYGLKAAENLETVIENYRPDYLELGSTEYQLLKDVLKLPYLIVLTKDEELPLGANPEMIIRKSESITNAGDLVFVTTHQEAELALTKDMKGVALTGSPESRPGIKDYNELSEILEFLETDD